jgi:tetratricopeptide (TPR) repeat protein
MKTGLYLTVALGIYCFAWSTIARAQQVKADTGGVAIVGNVSSSTINIGVPAEQLAALVRQAGDLSETQKKLITKLEGELDLNRRQIHAALDILGEANVPSERLAAKLVEFAERFKVLQATASAQPGDGPAIAAVKGDVQKAIDAGELAKADALLADVETEQRRARNRLAVNEADTSARRGAIALARLRYGEAAMHFANAAAVLPQGSADEHKRISYLESEANALFQQGDEFGDNGALLSAIERYRRLIALTPHEGEPLNWAKTQNNLGHVLWRLGERERGTAKLEEAVAAYREALKEWTRERVPLNWARTQNNLGVALQTLGGRENNTAKLEEAVAAYREALKEWTRERVPLDWARTQNNLGVALEDLGKRENDTSKLEEAITAYREALKERTRERVPLNWARTQNNLGVRLQVLGGREYNTA